MLDPTNLAKGPLVGSDIFKFLARHTDNMSREFKARIKAALKAGMAISMDLQLFTRRSMIFRGVENFATHWTPLKDEHSRVRWVVVTLGSTLGAWSYTDFLGVFDVLMYYTQLLHTQVLSEAMLACVGYHLLAICRFFFFFLEGGRGFLWGKLAEPNWYGVIFVCDSISYCFSIVLLSWFRWLSCWS